VATLGGGLGRWTGETWEFIRPTGSQIPTDLINVIVETRPGFYWLGFSYSTEPGGLLATFDGAQWRRYGPNNSGFDGGEPLSIVQDSQGRLWFGTLADGLQIFAPTEQQN
jgi:ligand-binding sensor domain-containing protein